MLTKENLQSIATKQHTSDYPNTVREYAQHLFLSGLYKREAAVDLLFKGGTALRVIYDSPRFSEDLDFSLFNVAAHERQRVIEDLAQDVLAELEGMGLRVDLTEHFGPTTDGYFGAFNVHLEAYDPFTVEINVSNRNGRRMRGEVATVANDFVPSYTLLHLPKDELVEEKIFGALLGRKKARDFYDLYFIMRKGLLAQTHKRRLADVKTLILGAAGEINFREELGALLPTDHQTIIRDFSATLRNELERQLVG